MIKKTMSCHSYWIKGEDFLHVETNKDYSLSDKKCEAIFHGDNPFPCFSMLTSYSVLASWLKANGWTRRGIVARKITTDKIDNETGEILSHNIQNDIYHYPVVGKATLDD